MFRSDSHALELAHLWATNSGLSKLQPALGSINTYLAWHSYFWMFRSVSFSETESPVYWTMWLKTDHVVCSSTDVLWSARAWTQGFLHKRALLSSELSPQLYVYSCFVLQRQDLDIAMHGTAHKLSNADRICAGLLPRRCMHLQEQFWIGTIGARKDKMDFSFPCGTDTVRHPVPREKWRPLRAGQLHWQQCDSDVLPWMFMHSVHATQVSPLPKLNQVSSYAAAQPCY